MLGPVVPFHEFLAKSRAASYFSDSLGESLCDSFTVDSEAGFGYLPPRMKDVVEENKPGQNSRSERLSHALIDTTNYSFILLSSLI